MVRGLNLFRDRFRNLADRYVLIGGTACDLVMSEAGLQFRATKDLDIVLCVEALDRDFGEALWAFVKAGGYQTQETAAGKKRFYRFQKPTQPDYPAMLELFSRVLEALSVADDSHLTPIPIDDEVSSLSAILLEDAYYRWIQDGRREVEGVPIVGPEHLIPLKAKAWLDLTAREESGASVDSRAIRKHKNDVFRLFQVIDPDASPETPPDIARDMGEFLRRVGTEETNLKSLGLARASVGEVLASLRGFYGLV